MGGSGYNPVESGREVVTIRPIVAQPSGKPQPRKNSNKNCLVYSKFPSPCLLPVFTICHKQWSAAIVELVGQTVKWNKITIIIANKYSANTHIDIMH